MAMTRQLSNIDHAARRGRHVGRHHAETILSLAQHLTQEDRLLIEQVYRHGVPAAHLAKLAGTPSRVMHRRIASLVRRMRDPLFRYVAGHLELLPQDTRATARRVVLQGQSLRQSAKQTGLSLHHTRKHLQTVRVMAGTF